MGRKWKVIWPENKMVTDVTIIQWAKEAVARGDISEIDLRDAAGCAEALDQAGIITLGIEDDK